MSGRFAVIIPVLDEAACIEAACGRVLVRGSGYAPAIVVVDGDPGGSTLSALTRPGTLKLTAPTGRASQMNAGALACTAEILVFLHADTSLPPGAFDEMDALVRGGAEAGFFCLEYDDPGLPLRLGARLASLRSRLFGVGFGDQAFFVRREVFEALGGFARLPVFEDLDLLVRLRRRGFTVTVSRLKVRTSARRFTREGVWRRILGNWLLQAGYALGVSPARLARWYGARPESEPRERLARERRD